jgi:endonuclease I
VEWGIWNRESLPVRLAALILLLLCAPALADYEAPNPAYDAPASYYNGAAGTGTTLRSNLHDIITAGFTGISYGDSRFILDDLDRDPNNPNNVILVYNRASVNGAWDVGITWNREHLWPQSKLGVSVSNGYIGVGSDLFELKPCNPSINSGRSNDGYGLTTSTGPYQNTPTYFYPGDSDKGDVARALFYMATRYYNPAPGALPSPANLSLVNGTSFSTYQMGDLQSLLKWNYTDGIDNFERRRNDMIYDTYQHNRNPFIDHPEYVWAIFGGSANNSQIAVASPNVNLGAVFVGGTLSTANVAINKTGSTPTTYDITLGGNATTTAAGVGQTFDYNSVSRTIAVGLNASTATAGLKTGAVSIHNSDLTSAGAGQGSADTNDVVNVSATVLAHANPSFNSVTDLNSLTLNFGTVYVGSSPTLPFAINGLDVAPGFTAPLKLTNSSKTGDAAVTTDLVPFVGLQAGSGNSFTAGIDGSAKGSFAANYTITLADDVTISGALSQQLTLSVMANVAYRLGDFNIDGLVTGADITAMLQALTDINSYESAHSLTNSDLLAIGDLSGDGTISNSDLQPLLDLLASGAGALAAVPEPSGLLLLVIGSVLVAWRNKNLRRF